MALQVTMEPSDGELVLRSLSGESQAFGRLVEKYQGLIYGLAYNKIGNTADAQDIAQDVFVRAFRKLSQLDDPDCFAAWIKTITANECKTWLRNLRPTVSLDESEYSPAHDAAAQSIWRYDEFRSEVAQAIQALPEKSRQVITLYYLSGMTCEEIAESLEASPSAVQSRLHRARQLLKAEFTGEIEQVLGGHRLPDGFSRDVLRRATLHPVEPGWRTFARRDGVDSGCVLLGVPQEPNGAMKLIAVSMRHQEASAIGMPPPGEPLSVAHRDRVKARIEEYRAKGMEPMEFILYLDEHDDCKGLGVFRQGRAKIKEAMKASLAIALALLAPAPILVEDRIAELREVGEDGFHWELSEDLDDILSGMRTNVFLNMVIMSVLDSGWDPRVGVATGVAVRDDEKRVVHITTQGPSGKTAVLESVNYDVGADYVWGLAERKEKVLKLKPDYNRCWMHFALQGEAVRVTAVGTDDPFPWVS